MDRNDENALTLDPPAASTPPSVVTSHVSATFTSHVAATHGAILSSQWVKRGLYLAADILSIFLAYVVSAGLLAPAFKIPNESPTGYISFFACFFAGILYLCDGYGRFELRRPEKELEVSVKAVSFAFLALLAANFVFFKGIVFSRYLVLFWYAFSIPFVLLARFGLRGLYSSLWKAGIGRQRALLVGSPDKFDRYHQLLSLQRCQAYDVVGVVCRGLAEFARTSGEYPVVGTLDSWEEAALISQARLVVVDLPSSALDHETVLGITRRCQDLNIEVELFSEVLSESRWDYEFDHFTGCFRLSGVPSWSWKVQKLCKYAIDRAAGVFGSLLTASITPLVGFLVFIEDPGPIFHKREFVGSDGSLQFYWKFRTMVRDADQILQDNPDLRNRFAANHKLRDDPRVLRVGRILRKYSIDEFPQFFSLLTGQLSLVGPRVISRAEISRYGPMFAKRLSVPPGITGYWQVMGRQNTSYDERIHMDMFYIDHWSIWLDVVIIAKTVFHLVRPEGAY